MLRTDLVAQPFQRDGICGWILEADFVRTRDHELRRDEAVFGAEHDPGIAEAFSVLAIEPKRRPSVGLSGGYWSAIRLAIPDFASTTRDHHEHPAVHIDGCRRGIRDEFVAHDVSPTE